MKPGRPGKYAKYEELLLSLPKQGQRRPKYIHGIGVFRGLRGDTAWLKIRMESPTNFRGRYYARGTSIELRLGKLSSWSWQQLELQYSELQGKATRGEALEAEEAPTFDQWSKEWLTSASKRLRGYSVAQTHIRTQLLPNFGKKRLDHITTRDVNSWIARRLETAKPATVKRELSTLSSIFGMALRSGLIDKNCCADTNTISGAVGRQRFLRNDEAIALLAAAEMVNSEFSDLLIWFIHSGMRKSEVMALTKADVSSIDESRAIVQVHRSKSDQPRIVPCTETMVAVFERQCARHRNEPKLFPISAMTLRRRWQYVRSAAKLNDVTIHDLRRTHATYAAAAGVDLRTLAERIGHTDLSMLQKHYAAVIDSNTSQAAIKVEAAMKLLTRSRIEANE